MDLPDLPPSPFPHDPHLTETSERPDQTAAGITSEAEKLKTEMKRLAIKTGGEFKAFLLRGNVIDLAVAVVVGAAFSGIVNALVKDLITPMLAAIGGKPDFSAVYFTINHARFMIGDFINALLSFLIIASTIFFLIVKPVNWLLRVREKAASEGDEGGEHP